MPETLLIESERRDTGSTSSTEFSFTFPQYLDIEAVELAYVQMPLAIFQITSSNNIIYFRENSTDKQATLTVGYYNAIDLAAEAESALNTASGGYATFDVDYFSTTFKMRFVSSQLFILQWATGGPYALFGFQATNTASATSVTSTQSVQISGPLALNISIREFDGVMWNSGVSVQGTFQFPLLSSLATISTYEPMKPLIRSFKQKIVKTLYIKVTDLTGNVIDINNQDWFMKIIAYSENDRHITGIVDEIPRNEKRKAADIEDLIESIEELIDVLKKRRQ